MAASDGRQSGRDLALSPRGGACYDSESLWQDHQYRFHLRACDLAGSSIALQCVKSRCDSHDTCCGCRIHPFRNPGELYQSGGDEGGDLFPEVLDVFFKTAPIDRCGSPEDHQGALLFLASELSDFVVGQEIVIDGRYTIM